ncbi:hypothetical protein J3F84DRAFT_373447 [Trichoderma pleuroticola]
MIGFQVLVFLWCFFQTTGTLLGRAWRGVVAVRPQIGWRFFLLGLGRWGGIGALFDGDGFGTIDMQRWGGESQLSASVDEWVSWKENT